MLSTGGRISRRLVDPVSETVIRAPDQRNTCISSFRNSSQVNVITRASTRGRERLDRAKGVWVDLLIVPSGFNSFPIVMEVHGDRVPLDGFSIP